MWYTFAINNLSDEPLSWGKLDPQKNDNSLHDIPFSPVNNETFWEQHKDIPFETPAWPKNTHKDIATGLIMMEPDNRIWLAEPSGHYGGIEHRFPKGRMEPNLTEQQNALKEAYEELGLQGNINGYFGDYDGDYTHNRYYLANRSGGAPWKSGWETQNVKLVNLQEARKLLNHPRDQKILSDLMKKFQANQPNIISQNNMTLQDVANKRETNQLGTNPGGWFRGTDNKRRYLKLYSDPGQANSEHIANLIYNGVGIPAPQSKLFNTNGQVVYSSDEMPGESIGITPNKQDAQSLLQGFAADVLLANWDVVGLTGDNILRHPNGHTQRIDNGGALLSRAMGSRKPDHLLMSDQEWDVFSGNSEVKNIYSDYFRVAGAGRPEEIIKDIARQIQKIEEFRQSVGGWEKLVKTNSSQLSEQDQKTMINMLNARSQKLNMRLHSL